MPRPIGVAEWSRLFFSSDCCWARSFMSTETFLGGAVLALANVLVGTALSGSVRNVASLCARERHITPH